MERDLGADDHALAIESVGGDSAQGRDQKYRDLAGESHRPQLQGGAGQAIDQPGLCNTLHPGADQGDELSAEEKLEVTVAQGSESGRKPAGLRASFVSGNA